MTVLSPDYAQFTLEKGVLIPGPRMEQKIAAIPFPDLKGKTVLDVGCDYGQFSFYAAAQGATVLGIDRNRLVKGVGNVDLISLNNKNAADNNIKAHFKKINLGNQWHDFGKHDFIFVMSVYHHIFENCGDHKAIWFWLWRHCKECVIWEGPTDNQDKVVQMNVGKPYTKDDILQAARIYFEAEYVGPAMHEPHRCVYKFYPKRGLRNTYSITMLDGTKGASKVFEYMEGRRAKEIKNILGYSPVPGSLNCATDKEFNWQYHYYPAHLLDVTERGKGLNVEWKQREARFFPVNVNGVSAHVFRFKGEDYPSNFLELVSPVHLRSLNPTEIDVCE